MTIYRLFLPCAVQCRAQISMLAWSSGRWLCRWDFTVSGLSCRRKFCVWLPTLSPSKATWACVLPCQLWLLIVRRLAQAHSSHQQLCIQSAKLCGVAWAVINGRKCSSYPGPRWLAHPPAALVSHTQFVTLSDFCLQSDSLRQATVHFTKEMLDWISVTAKRWYYRMQAIICIFLQ